MSQRSEIRLGTHGALAHDVLTLILVTSLQVAPAIDLSDPPERPRVRSSRAVRSIAMTATSFGAIVTTSALGGVIGLGTGALLSRGGFGALPGILVGLGVGGGLGLLLSPLLVWTVGRALGGEGTLAATFAGMFVGLLLGAGGFGLTVALNLYSFASWVPVLLAAPAVIGGGLWAFEISDAVTVEPGIGAVTVRF